MGQEEGRIRMEMWFTTGLQGVGLRHLWTYHFLFPPALYVMDSLQSGNRPTLIPAPLATVHALKPGCL